jgi:hypothetical protein
VRTIVFCATCAVSISINNLLCFSVCQNREDGEGGILGFLISSNQRNTTTDTLPFSGTIIFDTADFNTMMKNGEAGMFQSQTTLVATF